MIRKATGNLLQADAEALVNTVNCVGFMGKGIALQFKQAWPENFEAYAKACKAGEVRPGQMFIWETGRMVDPKFIINFPTKRDWRGKSRITDIENGLRALIADVRRLGIRSIAVPPLGCGNGGLNWRDIRPLIEEAFAELPEVSVLLYSPEGAPAAKTMPVNTAKPKMTASRALFIKLMNQYGALSYRRTLLEIQKLGYFLQEAGEPLRLRFEAGLYGPYAPNLNKVLELIEGHFTRGYGDSQRPDAEIELLPGAVEAADDFLTDHRESVSRLTRVAELIQGFETPYGMELLSTVHWVCTHSSPNATTANAAIQFVQDWNERKREMFRPEHIRVAYDRLRELSWIH
ncbi:Appr-1-p processing protein [bacterium]|jgi:O-acetyl-ADP-ribose deacetylase (regulator of RNase III)|nr:MAG: Appr-1-p processing protein [bacterium]